VQSKRARSVFLFATGLIPLVFAAGIVSIGPLRWRAIVLFDKATGRLNDVKWSEVGWMLSRGNGVNLERLAATRNPHESVEPTQIGGRRRSRFASLFRQQCGTCHGEGGLGGPGGPALRDHVFRQGPSDWALYRTIMLGIPNTAMPGRSLPRDDTWRLVMYLKRSLAGEETKAPPNGSTPTPVSIVPIIAADLRGSEEHPAEWLMYSRSYASHRHSRLTQINRENIGELRVEWQRQLSTPVEKVETSPVVRGSTMFVTEPPNQVHALDATTGRVLWTYSRDLLLHLSLCCGPVNRGLALLGDRVFVGTLDAHLVALNAATGRVMWDIAVAECFEGVQHHWRTPRNRQYGRNRHGQRRILCTGFHRRVRCTDRGKSLAFLYSPGGWTARQRDVGR